MISSSFSLSLSLSHTHTHTLSSTLRSLYSLRSLYFSVFTFLLSRDTYYSYHPPFYINYHIVSPFISPSLSLSRSHERADCFSPLVNGDFLLVCSPPAHRSVISLRGHGPVRGTCRRLHWACLCTSHGLDALSLVASC